ncbi:MAG: hypothetical protein HC773_31920 [Scytonema sp. CRU_2_7]|nr:hypothetical protein [Scytonema sp. CRU_2_7]
MSATNGFPSAAFSTVEAGGVGNGGEIYITAGSLELTNGGQLNTFVRGASETASAGKGNAGDVKLDIRNGITIAGVNNNGVYSGIFSSVNTGQKAKVVTLNSRLAQSQSLMALNCLPAPLARGMQAV